MHVSKLMVYIGQVVSNLI